MVKPLIVVFSQNPRFTSELHVRLKDHYRFAVCEAVDEVDEFFRMNRSAGLVVDFVTACADLRDIEPLLNDLRERFADMAILVMTAEGCPESLAELAACHDIVPLQGDLDCEAVAAVLTDRIPVDTNRMDESDSSDTSPRDESPGRVDASDTESKAVLAGITRKFETNTMKLKEMLSELEVAARHDVTILLIGETGSGKTFLSKLIHEVSPRGEAPFLTVACGALPAELIESELFGHMKGAFTSAHADKEGKFLAAGSGTILLDEIDVLGPEQQIKLLRVIETGEFEPVGSNQTHQSRARLVVASNLDLQPLVEQGKFRPDLYYRLNMLKFEIPPLRERKPDIIPLAKKFVQEQSSRHKVEIKRIEPNVFDVLNAYPWPGNVRELENVIQRAVIYCRDGVLAAKHLPPHIVSGQAGPTSDPSVCLGQSLPAAPTTLGRQVALTEREIIEQTLFNNNFSRTNTAKELGISRVTLYNKMKKYGMTKSK